MKAIFNKCTVWLLTLAMLIVLMPVFPVAANAADAGSYNNSKNALTAGRKVALSAETDVVAKVNGTDFASFNEALTTANGMTGDVTVEIYGKVEYSDASPSLTGAYDTINFVGKTIDAEFSITRNGPNGYISGEGNDCAVTFTDLILSKPVGGFADDAAYMNAYFTVYWAGTVTYTNCTFPDGACAQGGTVTYTGCNFANQTSGEYSLWVYADCDVTVNGGSFTGVRGVKMYAEGGFKTGNLTLDNVNFTSSVTQKPAIVLTYGESVTLTGDNTYPAKGVFELDVDGSPDGTTVTTDGNQTITCVNDNGVCGVLVDGKIYTTVADAATVATDGSAVTLLYSTTETVEFPEGVTLKKADGVVAENVTVYAPVYVAYIGTKGYETVQAAINAAQKDDTVVISAGEYGAINISDKNITIQGTVGDNGELLTTLTGNDPVITGHRFNGTIKDLKIGECWKVMYAEPAGNVTVDNVYVTGATYGFHLVAYSAGLTWTIQNSYMDLRWANSFGVAHDGDATVIIKGNEFDATNPFYAGGDVYPVNTYMPNLTVEENIFGEDTRISIENVTDTSKINISKNYHADGVENAFDSGSVKVPIKSYYKGVDADGNLTGLVTGEAAYTVEIYTMDINGEYGDPETENFEGTSEEIVTYTPAAKTGFTVDTEASVLTGEIAADGSLVLKVYYARDKHALKTDIDGVIATVKEYYYGETISEPDHPAKTGHEFTAWSGYTSGMTMGTEDIILTAVWDANDYVVKFESKYGYSTMNDQKFTYGEAQTLNANEFKRTGYRFVGWALTEDGEAVFGDEEIVMDLVGEGSITLYAVWQLNIDILPFETYLIYIKDSENGEVSTARKRMPAGTTVVLEIEPDAGYELESISAVTRFGFKVKLNEESDGTYTFKMPISQVNVTATFKKIETAPVHECLMDNFTDLDKDMWYHGGVDFVLENELMNGTGDGKFSPDVTLNRAMLVTMLWRLEGCPEVDSDMQFTDVAADEYYTEAVRWAASTGITEGFEDDTFKPLNPLTREQMATMLYRYVQSKGEGFTGMWMFRLDYTDAADVSEWAYEAMCWMTMNGIIEGKENSRLDPLGSATRAQAATILYRLNTQLLSK